MYFAKIHFWLVGMTNEHREILQGIAPLERFSHHYFPMKSMEELQEDYEPGIIMVVIVDEEADFSLEALKNTVPAAKVVYCTSHPGELSAELLSAVDFLWSKPLTKPLLSFYFSQLVQYLKQEKDLWLAETYLDNTIDPVPDLIWYKDIKGAHLKVNDAFCKVVDKTKEDIAGRGHCYIWGLTPEEYAQGEYVCMETEDEVINKGATCLFDEQVKTSEGMRFLLTYKTPIRDVDGTIIGTVGMARDVTKEREYQQKILEMAQNDALTGLANRRYMESYVKERLEKGDIQQQTFIYFDLDHFKDVNDTYGHAMGDRVLVGVASYMRKALPDAFLVRLGGDEFLAVFFDFISPEQLRVRVENFIAELQEYFETCLDIKSVSTSAGIVMGNSGASMDEMLRKSDVALYVAKNSGRACCRFYEPSMEQTEILK